MKDNNIKLKSIYDTSIVIKNNDLLAKQISDYLKEYLKIKRFGGNGGKFAYIDDEGKFIKHIDINELSIKDL